MKTVIGNVLDLAEAGEFDLVLHGCNCFNRMGAGIALQIAKRYPQVLETDKKTRKGDPSKLGTNALVPVLSGRFKIVNMYTQYNYGSGEHLNYEALETCLNLLALQYHRQPVRIGYPLVGGGLAGGDPERIKKLFDYCLEHMDHTLVLLGD